MIRRQFMTSLAGLVCGEVDVNPPLGPDRREWLRWRKNRWEAVNTPNDLVADDIVMQIDIADGCLTNVQVFKVKAPSKDGKEIEASWYVDIDALGKSPSKKKE